MNISGPPQKPPSFAAVLRMCKIFDCQPEELELAVANLVIAYMTHDETLAYTLPELCDLICSETLPIKHHSKCEALSGTVFELEHFPMLAATCSIIDLYREKAELPE